MKSYTIGEEIFNSVSHGVGALLSVIGFVFLITNSIPTNNTYTITASIIYGVSLFVLYLMSCLYHAIQNKEVKRILRIFDHSTIFLLIMGSYMPFLLVSLIDKGYAIYVAGIMIICSIVGIILNVISLQRFEKLSMILYLVMGWSIIIVMKDLIQSLTPNALMLLVLGGLAYSGGVFFYKARQRYMHSIWHLFVLAGSVLHYFCIIYFVI